MDMLQSLSYHWSSPLSSEEHQTVDKLHQVINNIAATTAKLDELKIERERVDKRLFALRAQRAPIARVPDEILRIIFEYGAETTQMSEQQWRRETTFQARCVQVCHRWRRVATDCTSLWTTYRIHNFEGLRALELLLKHRHTTCPLSIEVLQESGHIVLCEAERPFIEALAYFLASKMDRLTSLSIGSTCSHTLSQLLSHGDVFPVLRTIHCEGGDNFCRRRATDDSVDVIDPRKLPNLTHYSSRHGDRLRVTAPAHSLLSLKLFRWGRLHNQVPSPLQDSSKLKRLEVQALRWNVGDIDNTQACRLTDQHLPNLEDIQLRLEGSHSTVFLNDLALTRLLSLRSLELACQHANWDAARGDMALLPFLRQAANLRHLKLMLCCHHTREVFTALHTEVDILPILSEIYLENCTDRALGYMNNRYWHTPAALYDIVDVLKPLADTRWKLMQQASPSAMVFLSHSLPAGRVDELRQLGIVVGLVDTPRMWWWAQVL
ncbi:hypothetical protein CALCODRAFT_501505 [Calocera cornea HHB12733]|uniref:F-box domain-containing protein n=1 Tax=Calocera cornea HHB12733 TaxID=1353952 RepID=A0A165DLP0_9BASI|nr:hypothetical protein CALCODRAFT_501505 [Calocera cornea HHB12733]